MKKERLEELYKSSLEQNERLRNERDALLSKVHDALLGLTVPSDAEKVHVVTDISSVVCLALAAHFMVVHVSIDENMRLVLVQAIKMLSVQFKDVADAIASVPTPKAKSRIIEV